MKGGLCVYTSLLTISLLSCFALFVLVVSEVGQARGDRSVDLSGLHNVSHRNVESDKYEPTVASQNEGDDSPEPSNTVLKDQEMIIADTLSLNSVTTDGLPDAGHPPILISLADNAKLDLKTPEELLFANDSDQHNDTKTFIIMDSGDAIEDKKDKSKDETKEQTEKDAEPHLVVKAKPMHEVRRTEDAFQTTTTLPTEIPSDSQTEEASQPAKENIPVKPQTPQEDIPSFSEWAQKQLAEAEKKDTVLNHSSQPSHSNSNFSNKNTKLRSKNYASLACGAKVVAVNPEAGSPSAILSPNRDEYMLNTCNSRIWFIVELCEAVQAQKIEIANFELFSSTPKDIAVYFSDRFPTRDWTSVGQFAAQDLRDVQSFDLFPHLFGKFIKVEMLSHHGSEHYCPISLFKVYGTSEFEVLEKESSQHNSAHLEDDEEDEIIDVPDLPTKQNEASKNLFGSARDAVMSIMKKAAQALVKAEVPKNVSNEQNDTSEKVYKKCCSPSHIIVCDNCSETLYNEVYELISCSSDRLINLLRQVFLKDTLKCTEICRPFGLDFKSTKSIEFVDERVAYLNALFPEKYISALCNMLAIKEKKVVLNTSFETESNVLANITLEESIQNISTVTSAEPDLFVPEGNVSSNTESQNEAVDTQVKIEEADNTNNSAVITEDTNTVDKEKVDDKNPELPITPEDKMLPDISQQRPEPDESPKSTLDDDKNVETKTEPEIKDATSTKNEEKLKEASGADELPSESLMMEGDSLISDLDQMAVDPTPPGMQPQNQNQAQTLQKESVFLRLSNRVKTLERNMSLSGQYLEELSRRYKKQVEEMQRTFENTVTQMTDERRKSNEREHKYLEQMAGMQEQITQMTMALKILMDERDSWLGNITVWKFIVLQSIIIAGIVYYLRRRKPEPIVAVIPKRVKKKQDKLRRKSVEGVSGHATPAAKQRRPSEEALQIARLCDDDDDAEWTVARKNRRRKTSILHRNVEKQWSRQDSIGRLQETPISLDEQEYLAPVSEPAQFSPTSDPPKQPLKNGILQNLKTIKTRRLSSPAFLRTFSRQTTRSTPSPGTTRALEPQLNGHKAASESPTGSLWSHSTELSHGRDSIDSSVLTTNNGKKKKSLKNIFKKVF